MRSIITVGDREIRIDGRMLRIGRLEADGYFIVDEPKPLLDALRQCGSRIDLFTFMQRLPETTPKYDYHMEWDNLAVLPVTTFDHWWSHQIRSFPRNRARQAEKKGVVLREVPFDETLIRGIWKIYNEVPIRQGKPSFHFGKDLATVFKEEATFLGNSLFIGAFLGDDLIGFIKMTWDETRTQANLMNIVSMVGHKDKAPTNALIAQAVRSCAERNISYLAYQRFSYGRKQRDSLSDFKENNGFQRVDLPRYYVPLTPLGAVALRLGLHRKLIDRIPESVASRLRVMRKNWHNRKFQSASEAV
jgi:hypothetical protein